MKPLLVMSTDGGVTKSKASIQLSQLDLEPISFDLAKEYQK